MMFKKLKKYSELRAWHVRRVVRDDTGNNEGRNQTMEHLSHIEELGALKARYCSWGFH